MQSICLDETKRLVVKFEPTGNFSKDYFIEDFLNESDFTKIENNFFYESEDIVEFKKRVKWTVDKFVKEFEGNLEICDYVNQYLDSINIRETDNINITNTKDVTNKDNFCNNNSSDEDIDLIKYIESDSNISIDSCELIIPKKN